MLTPEQVQQIISDNNSLQAEVNEEIVELRKVASETAALRSMVDIHLEELQFMQNHIGKHQQKAAGAEERELELQQELTGAARLQQQYTELFQQYTYTSAQLEDVQQELAKLKKRNNMLQQIAVKIGEMESSMEMLTDERDHLQNKVALLEKLQTS
jgi:predicted  nucleic acid-binding Zn-ribbon protein